MTEPRRRPYHSQLRHDNAEATRVRIAAAARTLMLARGYAGVSMADVASEAGVAVQTLYGACPGGKPALAKLVWDTTLAGDARPLPLRERPAVQAIIAEPDPVRKLALFAAMATAICHRTARVHQVLRAAAALADNEAADVLAATERERLTGSFGPVEDLASVDALRAGLSIERAAHQVYALTSVEVYERLTQICGWEPAEYQDWLARQLRGALLAP